MSRDCRRPPTLTPIMIAALIIGLTTELSALPHGYTETRPPTGMTSIASEPGVVTHWDHSVAPFSADKTIVPLPFDFRYFGDTFPAGSDLTITTLGWIGFGDETFGTPGLPPIGAPAWPNATISVMQRNFTSAPGAVIQSVVLGSAPNRVFVVEWNGLVEGTRRLTGQVRLAESTNEIELAYDPTTSSGALSGLESVDAEFTRFTTFRQPSNGNVLYTPPSLAELSVEGATGQTAHAPGSQVDFLLRVRNSAAPTGPVRVVTVLSSDETYDPTDAILVDQSYPTLSGRRSQRFRVTLPATLPAGARFLTVIDPDQLIAELDEANNIDLQHVSPKTVRSSRRIEPTGAWFSIAGLPGVQTLFSGQSGGATASTQLTLPFTFTLHGRPRSTLTVHPQGVVSADPTLRDSNLIRPQPGDEGRLVALLSELGVPAGSQAAVYYNVTGPPGARTAVVEFSGLTDSRPGVSLSGQVRINEATSAVTFRYPPPATQNKPPEIDLQIYIPGDLTSEFYGLNRVNRAVRLPDYDLTMTPLDVSRPDLSFASVRVERQPSTPGRQTDFLVDVENRGAASPDVTISFRLRASSTEIPIGAVLIPGFAPGERRRQSVSLTLPQGIAAGSWTLLAELDPFDVIPETFESNNTGGFVGLSIHLSDYGRTVSTTAGYTAVRGRPGAQPLLLGASPPIRGQAVDMSLIRPFEFFGRLRQDVRVSTQGSLSFDLDEDSSLITGPGFNASSGILPLHTDLELGPASGIYTLVEGQSPGLVTHVEWNRVTPVGSTVPLTFSVRLIEADQSIEMAYAPLTGSPEFASAVESGVFKNKGFDFYRGTAFLRFNDTYSMSPPQGIVRFERELRIAPELRFANLVAVPEVIQPDGTTTLHCVVENLGLLPAVNAEIAVFETLGSFRFPVDTSFATRVGTGFITVQGESTGIVDVFVRFPSAQSGQVRVLAACIDPTGAVGEGVTEDNIQTTGGLFVTDMSDTAELRAEILSVTGGSGSGGFPRGSQPTATVQVHNDGTVSSFSVLSQVLASDDAIYDLGDPVIGSVQLGPVPPGGAVSGVLTLDLLPLPPGPAHLFLRTDPFNNNDERNRVDNISSPLAVTIEASSTAPPDLVIVSLDTTGTTVELGGSIPVTAVIANASSVDYTGFFSVETSMYEHSGFFFAGRTSQQITTGLAAGQSLTVTSQLSPFSHTPVSSYSLDCRILSTNMPEVSSNNRLSGRDLRSVRLPTVVVTRPFLNPRPELILEGPTSAAPLAASPGDTIQVLLPTVVNAGDGTSVPSAVLTRFGTAIGPGNLGVGIPTITPVPGLVAGERFDPGTISVTVPAGLVERVEIQSIVDPFDENLEWNEDNSQLSFLAIDIAVELTEPGIDLTLTDFQIPSSMLSGGDVIAVTRALRNLGFNPGDPLTLELVLSDDMILDSSDIVVGNLGPEPFTPGGIMLAPKTSTLTMPFGLPAGPGFLGLVVDRAGVIPELDETNNVRFIPVSVASGPRCDLNGDGQVQVSDVQLVINVALGTTPSNGLEDIDNDGAVTVADVQSIINGALGLGCP